MIGCSAIFGTVVWGLGKWRHGEIDKGEMLGNPESGLVLANGVQMLGRIGFAGYYAWMLYRNQTIRSSKRRIRLLPGLGSAGMILLAGILLRMLTNTLNWQGDLLIRGLTIVLGGILGIVCLGIW